MASDRGTCVRGGGVKSGGFVLQSSTDRRVKKLNFAIVCRKTANNVTRQDWRRRVRGGTLSDWR